MFVSCGVEVQLCGSGVPEDPPQCTHGALHVEFACSLKISTIQVKGTQEAFISRPVPELKKPSNRRPMAAWHAVPSSTPVRATTHAWTACGQIGQTLGSKFTPNPFLVAIGDISFSGVGSVLRFLWRWSPVPLLGRFLSFGFSYSLGAAGCVRRTPVEVRVPWQRMLGKPGTCSGQRCARVQ